MTIRPMIALAATVGLILVLVACGGGGSKSNATKTPKTKTPGVTGTANPNATLAPGQTPGSGTTPVSQGGGDGNENPTQPSAPATPRLSPISGDRSSYRVTFVVASDPGNLQQLVEQRSHRIATRLSIAIGNGQISIDAPEPFTKVRGTIDASGAFTATGTGSFNPYDNVEVTFQGTIGNGQLTGTYAIGTNGALPGRQPITYNVTGTSEVPQTPTG